MDTAVGIFESESGKALVECFDHFADRLTDIVRLFNHLVTESNQIAAQRAFVNQIAVIFDVGNGRNGLRKRGDKSNAAAPFQQAFFSEGLGHGKLVDSHGCFVHFFQNGIESLMTFRIK